MIEQFQDTRSILLIDALNSFTRSYCVYPQMTKNGEQCGGVIGFLKTLRKLAFEIKPKQIIVAWEGGGSARRRALYSEYKQNRKAEKLNRFYEDDIPDTDENKMKQIQMLVGLLKSTPVCQVYVADCEADDVIGHLCSKFKSEKKVIASSDKDFYQLLDENTMQYSLHKKTFVTPKSVKDEYFIHPRNFALAKALCGDKSDNIPGVAGLGFKTVVKRFPIIASDDCDILLDDIFEYASVRVDKAPIYKRVLEAKDDIKRNWKLVYLNTSSLSSQQISKIDEIVGTFTPAVNKIAFTKRLIQEGIDGTTLDVERFFYSLFCIQLQNGVMK